LQNHFSKSGNKLYLAVIVILANTILAENIETLKIHATLEMSTCNL